MILQAELLEQSTLINLSLARHWRHPRKDAANESAIESEGNRRVLQHNRLKADYLHSLPVARRIIFQP